MSYDLRISQNVSVSCRYRQENAYLCSNYYCFMPMNVHLISIKEYAAAHGVAERTVRNYCALGKIEGAVLIGKTWSLPSDAPLPARKNARNKVSPLLQALNLCIESIARRQERQPQSIVPDNACDMQSSFYPCRITVNK